MSEFYVDGPLLIAGTRFRLANNRAWYQLGHSYIADRVWQALEFYGPSSVIHGGASGVDKEGGLTASEFGFADDQIKVVRPDWQTFGKSAGFVRNKDMVEQCAAACVIWDGRSGGTKNTLQHLFRLDKPHTIYMVTPSEVKRFFPTEAEERAEVEGQGMLGLE